MSQRNLCTEFEEHHGTDTSKTYQKDNFNSKFKECSMTNTIPLAGVDPGFPRGSESTPNLVKFPQKLPEIKDS